MFLGMLAAVLITPRSTPWGLAGVAVALLALGAAARLPAGSILWRIMLFEPVALGVAAMAFLQPHGAAIFVWIVIRSTLCLLAMVLLAATTPFSDELRVLRRLRVPALLVTTLALMHRYLHVIQDEALRMRRAQACRTFAPAPGFGAWRLAWVLQAGVAGRLFLRTVDRAERVYLAMCARGWR